MYCYWWHMLFRDCGTPDTNSAPVTQKTSKPTRYTRTLLLVDTHVCTHTIFTLFQVTLMLPNTAMIKPMVNSALMILLVANIGDWLEGTTKTELPTAMDHLQKENCAWRVADWSSGTIWYWNDRLHVCVLSVCVYMTRWIFLAAVPKVVSSEHFVCIYFCY